MPAVLIRELEPATIDRLKARAKRNRRSLQAEMRVIAEAAAMEESPAATDFWELAAAMRERLKGTQQTDSAVLIREFRDE